MATWPPIWLALFAALAAAVVAGLLLLILGLWPRRRGTDPFCRQCGYNLTGRTADRCSECGAALTAPRAIRIGQRYRRWALAIPGGILVLFIAAGAATAVIGNARNVDWYVFHPTNWVLNDCLSVNATLAARATSELRNRLIAGKLNPEQIDRLAEFCLAQQAKADPGSAVWFAAEPVLGMLYKNGNFAPGQRTRFLENIGVVRFRARPRIVLGQSCPTKVELDGFGFSCGFSVMAVLKALQVDGVDRTSFESYWYAGATGSGSVNTVGTNGQVELSSDGEHEIRCEFELRTYSGDDASFAFPLRSPQKANIEALAKRTIVLTQRVQVFAQEPADLFKTTSSRAMDAAVRAALRLDEFRIESPTRISGWVTRIASVVPH